MYQNDFLAAADMTKRFGLSCPNIEFIDERFLSEEKINVIKAAVGEIDINELFLQCLSIHYEQLNPVSSILATSVYYTIGYVDIPNCTLFKQDENSLQKMLESGVPSSKKLNLHAWLTLPSSEILDFSLSTTLANKFDIKDGLGGLLYGHADEFKNDIKYHPLLVGDDFLRKLGALK